MKYLSLTIPGTNGDVNINGAGNMPQGGPDALKEIVMTGINVLILAAIILSLFFLVWGGFNWLMSEGDKQRLGNARQKIVYSILGLLVVFFSFLIVNLIYGFLFGGKATLFNYK